MSMIKKPVWLLLICLLLLTAGGFFYWKLSRPLPRNAPVVSNWPAIGPTTSPNAPPTPTPEAPFPGESATKKENALPETAFTLRQGEILDYNANVPKLNSTVANLRIIAAEKRGSVGKASWHLQAFAHTENPYRMVFALDDQFDSYSDARSMTSLQYEMHLNERGEKVDSVERLLSSAHDPAPMGASAARVLPGTRDPLGMLEYLRSVDWGHTAEVRSPVYDGHKLYDVRAVLVGKSAAVSVPAGNFNTTKIEIHVLDNGTEMKDAHFLLYLKNDATRLPVLMEAVLPVATARVELTKSN
ncbi:MAG: DUF3108 domain-containing protein [Candidatus Acidiferrum sp.]